MAKGICSVCGKPVGGLFQPTGYVCPGCQKVYCANCAAKTGKLVKHPNCPNCGRRLGT